MNLSARTDAAVRISPLVPPSSFPASPLHLSPQLLLLLSALLSPSQSGNQCDSLPLLRPRTHSPELRQVRKEIYTLEPEASLSIGKPSEGHQSAYYPSNPAPSDAEIDEVQAICDKAGVSTLNTRSVSSHISV